MNILEVKQVSKSFGNKQVLNRISLDIPKNSIYGLLGPNGAGKTTLIRIINQIINNDEGEIMFNHKPITRTDIQRLGYLPEERGLYGKMKVGEHLIYLAHLKGMKGNLAGDVIRQYLKEFEIQGWWNMKVEQLSKGMQQKLQFIIAIMHKPEFVILDEPFTGFDPVNIDLIRNKILELKAAGTTFMLSTHRMESVEELCDHVTLINKANKVIDGEKYEIKRRYSENLYQIEYAAQEPFLKIRESRYYSLTDNSATRIQGRMALKIQLKPGSRINDVLPELLSDIEICSVNEIIPSMHDIFVSLVKENNNE